MKRLELLAIVAAAGMSARFCSQKALYTFKKKSLLRHSVDNLARIFPKRIYVTLSPMLMINSDVRCSLADFDALAILNKHESLGYAGSIKTALLASEDHFHGALITPVDAPILSTDLLFAVVNFASSLLEKPAIIVPHFYERPAHPIYISHHFFSELLTSKDFAEKGLRGFINAHQENAHAFFWHDARILMNVNEKTDLKFMEQSRDPNSHQNQR